jgi:hypothetical protein
MFEVTVKNPTPTAARIALPYFVGKLRAVKGSDRMRIDLNTPRPYYQDESYFQSPYTWRVLNTSPLKQSIVNATRLKFSIPEAELSQFKVTIMCTDDNGSDVRNQLVFPVGTKEVWTTRQITDASSIVKDSITEQNVHITGANNEDFGFIPNLSYDVRHQVIQIHDRCTFCCATCRCYDILYKKPTPVLYYDEQYVPYAEVIMTKALEWITMPKEGLEQKTAMFSDKSKSLLSGFNANNIPGLAHKVDLGRNLFCSNTGFWWRKI